WLRILRHAVRRGKTTQAAPAFYKERQDFAETSRHPQRHRNSQAAGKADRSSAQTVQESDGKGACDGIYRWPGAAAGRVLHLGCQGNGRAAIRFGQVLEVAGPVETGLTACRRWRSRATAPQIRHKAQHRESESWTAEIASKQSRLGTD